MVEHFHAHAFIHVLTLRMNRHKNKHKKTTQVLRTRAVNGRNSTFVGYGPETLQASMLGSSFVPGVSSLNAYGAHFAIELNDMPRGQDVSRAPWIAGNRWLDQSINRLTHYISISKLHKPNRATCPSWTRAPPWPTSSSPSPPSASPSSSVRASAPMCLTFYCIHRLTDVSVSLSYTHRGRRPGPLRVRLGAGRLAQRADAPGTSVFLQ